MNGRRRAGRLYARTALGGGALAFGLAALAATPARANPEGGTVSAGAAVIHGQGTSLVQVTQHTDRAVIDWKSFDIPAGERTVFTQPSSFSAVLNRIHDQNPSQIFGHLSANGTVALVNPNGMVFGQGSRVDVGSLIATTADIPNERFMEGRWLFGQPGEADAAIVNQGSLTVREGGLAALVAPQVRNSGVIEAKLGRVALGAGDIFSVDLYSDGLVSVAMPDQARIATVQQAGGIRAEGGTVLLTTAEAKRVIDQAVNMDGWVDVSSLTVEAGSIVLHAAKGTAEVTGKLHADGAAGKGGNLQVTGEDVKIGAGAVLTALGTYGGGEVKIGGDYFGGGTTPRARTTRVEPGATIEASANVRGDGGQVIVWSDEHTEFGGLIRAKGGLLGGDGGFVETSSKEILTATGWVDASAPQGKGGTWLLDPNNITIDATADANVAGSPDFVTTNDNAVVTVNSIQTALNAGTSVSITTGTAGANSQEGNITVNSAISKTAGGDASLTLKAHENIDVNAGISSNSGALDVTLWSDSDNSSSGYIRVTNAAITTNGGDVVMGGGANPAANPARGNATVDDGITLNNGDISTDAGNISLRGLGEAAGASNIGVLVTGGSVLQTTTGNITLVGTGGAGTSANYGIFVNGAGNRITSQDGDISLTGTGGSGSAPDNNGVYLNSSALVESTGTGAGAGTITINGAGSGVQWGIGFRMNNSAAVTSVDGDIVMIGTSNGTSDSNIGVYLDNSSDIISTGTGAEAANISVTGTGSSSGTSFNIGTELVSASAITTVDGDITLTGTGGSGTSNFNMGVYFFSAAIASTGTGAGAGNITLIGTGGPAAGAGNNHGIYLDTSSQITAAGPGAISFTGQVGAVSGDDISASGGANVIGGAGADGDITLTGNTFNLAALSVQTTADITVRPRTANTTIGLAGGAGTLNLTTTEMGFFNAGDELIIGRNTGTGLMNVSAYATWSTLAGTGLRFVTDTGLVSFNGAQDFGARNLTMESNTEAVVGAPVTGSGMLTLMPSSSGTTMGVTGGAGSLNFSSVDIAAFGAAWTGYLFGRSDQTGTLETGASAWSAPVTWRSGAAGNILISGAQTAGAASNTIFTFSGPTTLAANVDLTNATGGAQDIVFADDVTLTGNAQVLAGNGDISVAGMIDGGFNLTLNAAGTVTLSDDVGSVTPLDDLTITTDADPSIGGTVAGTGVLTLQQKSNATTMGVAGGAGALNYSAADLAGLGAGWTSMRFGSTTATGALTVGANAWSNPVQYRSAAAGSIVITGAQTSVAASDASFTFSGPTSLGANVTTAAATGGTQDITFSDDVTLTGNAQILAGNGDLSFAGTIDGAFDLTLTAAGVITLSDDVGSGIPLDDLTISSDADPAIAGAVEGTGVLTLQQASNATTMGVAGGAGALNYSAADLAGLGANWTSLRLGSTTATGPLTVGARAWDLPVDYRAAAAGSIVISGAQTATAASDTIFTFSGPATINAPVHLTGATGGTRAITFTSPAAVNADVTSDSGDIAFAGTLSLGADIATGGGDITLADDVTLTGISSIDTDSADILFAGTLDGAFALELTTTGDITFNDDVGGVARLGDVTVDPRHVMALGLFNAASFTLTNGTGNVSFGAVTGLNTTGDIAIDTNGNIVGIYQGANGVLDAGAGTITAEVTFTGLDITGAGATLSGGYIGAPGQADQAMANLISIGGVAYPVLVPDNDYTFEGFVIGGSISSGGGRGGTPPIGETPPVVLPPVAPRPEEPAGPIAEPPGEPSVLSNYLWPSYPYLATEAVYTVEGARRHAFDIFTFVPRGAECDRNSILECSEYFPQDKQLSTENSGPVPASGAE